MSEELKPCPFCGGRPEVYHSGGLTTAWFSETVGCPRCGIAFQGDSRKKVIANWNNRAQTTEAEVLRLHRVLGRLTKSRRHLRNRTLMYRRDRNRARKMLRDLITVVTDGRCITGTLKHRAKFAEDKHKNMRVLVDAFIRHGEKRDEPEEDRNP